MKKLLFGCLSIALMFALLFPAAAIAAGQEVPPDVSDAPGVVQDEEPAEAQEDEETYSPCGGTSQYPGIYDESFLSDFPTLDEWGTEDLDEYVYWLAEHYYIVYVLYLEEPLPYPPIPLWEAIDPSAESLAEFLEKYGMELDDYFDLEDIWDDVMYEFRSYMMNSGSNNDYYNRYRDESLERIGGTPGYVNVMYNGEFMKFNGAVPEIIDDVTFVPARLFFETLGAKVEFNEGSTITAKFDDFFVMFKPGDEQMTMMGPGVSKVFEFYEPPFINGDGYSYIPVREVAQALGFDVYWDYYYNTVVIIDTAGLIAQIDADFAELNKLLSMPMHNASSSEGVYKTTLSMPGSLKMFDSLDGDKTAKIGSDAEFLTDGHSLNAKLNVSAPELIDLLFSQYPDDIFDEDLVLIKQLLNTEADLILNYDEDILYVKSPFLSSQIRELPDGAWISIKNASELMEDIFIDRDTASMLSAMNDGGLSMGLLIYSMSGASQYYNQVFIYDDVISAAEGYKSLFSDSKIKIDGDDYVISLTLDDLAGESASSPYPSSYYRITKFGLDIRIKTIEGAVKEISGNLLYREDQYYGLSTTQYEVEFFISADRISLSYEIHEKNAAVMRFDMELETAEEKEAAALLQAPPAGDKVFPVEDFISDGYDEYNSSAINQLAN